MNSKKQFSNSPCREELEFQSRYKINNRKNYKTLGNIFWAFLGLFVCLHGYHLGIGRLTAPGPGFFPLCLGILLFFISGIILIKNFNNRKVYETEKDNQPLNLQKVIAALAALFLYGFFLEALGFLLTTFVVMAVLFRIAGYKKIIPIVSYSAITVIITFLLFKYLGVNFPAGVFRLLGF